MRHFLRYLLLSLTLLLSVSLFGQSTKWRDIYQTKKKDTLFGIANKYGITVPDLLDANPDMKTEGYVLKKGTTVFIPFAKPERSANSVKTPATPAKVVTSAKAATPSSAIRVGMMLPLHDVDGDGRRMVEYYRGFLMAVEDMKRQGFSTEVYAWNVPIDADMRQTLLKEGVTKCDVIFGPLYSKQVAALGEFCKAYDIKMVIPFSISGNEVNTNRQVYQVYQSAESLNRSAINAYLNRFSNAHPIFIDCNDTASTKGIFTFGLRKQLESRGIKYSITNLNSSPEAFAKAFDRSKQNVVILNSGRSPLLTAALNKLDLLNSQYPGLVVSLYGYTEWLMYTKYNLDRFFRYDTYIPSTFYYNASNAKTVDLERRYKSLFGADMLFAMPRFALIGYDQAQFFLRGFKRFGKNFTGEKAQNTYQPLQTPLYFEKAGRGGFQNHSFLLIHYTFNKQIESIAY